MSRIAVSFSDKGREHLFRALTIVELLADHHDVLLIAPSGQCRPSAELCKKYRRVELFVPTRASSSADSNAKRTDKLTGYSWSGYSLIENKIQRFAPDLLITGSETLLPRIGKRLGIRCIRIDYEHFLDDIDLRTIPLSSRLPLWISKFARRVLTRQVDEQLVSSFHPYPLRDFSNLRTRRPYRRVGVLLRKELQTESRQEAHLLVRMADKNKYWLEELAKIRLPAKIYGLGAMGREGSLEFRNSTHPFAEDLLSCAGVVTDVGNQLIGEALACGKPVLAIPDPSDYHQRISALFLSKCELTGTVAPTLTARLVSDFYSSSPQAKPAAAVPIANDEVKSLIEVQLNNTQHDCKATNDADARAYGRFSTETRPPQTKQSLSVCYSRRVLCASGFEFHA